MNLYVGNLDFEVTEEEIKILFEQVGDVTGVRLMLDKETGRSKGFAFVQMEDIEEAVIALKTLNGREFHGRNIVVNQGTEDSDRKKSFGSDNRSENRRSYGDDQKGSYGGGERKSYGNGERKSFDGERRSYDGEKRNHDGERKSYDGERRSYDNNQQKPSFNRDRNSSERSSYSNSDRPYESAQHKSYDAPKVNPFGDDEVKKPVTEYNKRPRRTSITDDKTKLPKEEDKDKKRFIDED